MNGVLAVVVFLAALNPARTRLGMPETTDRRLRFDLAVPGILTGIAFLVLVASFAERGLDALEISPETFRIAAGFVLVIVAAWMLFQPVPTAEPVASGRLGALWPVAYPRIVSPESLTLAVTMGASDGLGRVIPGLAIAAAVLLALGVVPTGAIARRLLAGIGRLLAVALVVAGVWLALQGVREV